MKTCSTCLLLEHRFTRRGIDDVIEARVRGREEDFALGHCGRGDYPAERIIETPFLFPGRGVKRVELGVSAAGVDDAVCHRRRRLEADLIVNRRVFTAMKPPLFFPGRSVDCVE